MTLPILTQVQIDRIEQLIAERENLESVEATHIAAMMKHTRAVRIGEHNWWAEVFPEGNPAQDKISYDSKTKSLIIGG